MEICAFLCHRIDTGTTHCQDKSVLAFQHQTFWCHATHDSAIMMDWNEITNYIFVVPAWENYVDDHLHEGSMLLVALSCCESSE